MMSIKQIERERNVRALIEEKSQALQAQLKAQEEAEKVEQNK